MTSHPVQPDARRSTLTGGALGIALMAAVDEIVFHQLLGWHHFYDRSTSQVGLLSDGLLHAAELVLLVAAGFWIADLARRRALDGRYLRGGTLVGAGLFQLFDGLVNHKVLGLHQVRYDVDLLPYDVAWNLAGGVLLVVGLLVLARARRRASAPPPLPR